MAAIERDYPEGHPSSCDYAGQRYIPPRAPWLEDYAPEHPARAGRNSSALDTPDGLRLAVVEDHQANADRARKMERTTNKKTGARVAPAAPQTAE